MPTVRRKLRINFLTAINCLKEILMKAPVSSVYISATAQLKTPMKQLPILRLCTKAAVSKEQISKHLSTMRLTVFIALLRK
jgi:hypothetical protein